MKRFNVYTHPTRGVEAVKVGFSWPAFFFGNIWMLVKKLWGLAALWTVGYVALHAVEAAMDVAPESRAQAVVYLIISAGYIALWLVPAFQGNRWREANLNRRGYRFLSAENVETPDAAIALAAEQGGPSRCAERS